MTAVGQRTKPLARWDAAADSSASIGMGASLSEDEGLPTLTSDRSIPMTDEAMRPLRRRMIEDMTIRKFAPKTRHDYVQRIKNFAAFLGRSPDWRASRTCAATSSIWRKAGRVRRPSTRPSRRFGSFQDHAGEPRDRRAPHFIHEPRKLPRGAQRRRGGAAARCRVLATLGTAAERLMVTSPR